MTDPVVARDEHGLREVAGAAHDLWFRLEDVDHDPAARRVRVPLTGEERHRWRFGFGLTYGVRGDTPAGTLTFEDIERCEVLDEARIDTNQVMSIVAEPAGDGFAVTLFGGAPQEIRMVARRVAARFDPPA